MEIRIHLPRPLLTLSLLTVGLLWWNGILTVHWPTKEVQADSSGGQRPASVITDARKDIDRERVKQAVLGQREEILRYNLDILEKAALTTKAPDDIDKLRQARSVLLSILKQRDESEKLLMLSLEQLWDAEGTAYSTDGDAGDRVLSWPVAPKLGISATFEDEGYEKRFGFPHHAIDIPTDQGTEIKAPADGTVLKVALNGLGYSYIVLQHRDGLQTIYGHISDSMVKEGDSVSEGRIIGHSGGQPWTIGAGPLTTGPHLHFGVRKDGVLVDPMQFLPTIKALIP